MEFHSTKTHFRLLPLGLLLYVLTPLLVVAQAPEDLRSLKGRRLELGLGYQMQRFKDARHSSIYRNAGGLSFSLAYRTTNDKRQQAVGLYFSNPNTHQDFASFARNFLGGLYFEHLRPVNKKLWFGGYMDLGALLSFRKGEWSDPAASISYGAWSSVGLAANMQTNLGKAWSINPSVRLPLLAYTIRPFYGNPYPDSFLKEGRFSFNEAGMAKDVLKSGRLQTLNQFVNLQVVMDIRRSFGARNHQIGLQLQSGYLFFDGIKPLASWQNQIALSSQFKLNQP